MSRRRCVPFALVALSACQAPTAPPQDPVAGTLERLADQLVDLRTQSMQFEAVQAPSAAAAIDELNARVATLNARLEQLTRRLAVPAPDAADPSHAAADASHTTEDPSASELAAIAVLRHSLAVLEQQEKVCCENIANVNVPGYKKRAVATTNVRDEATGMLHPKALPVTSVFTVGALEITERSLDLAIDGDGFLSVLLHDGCVGYTRDGNLHVNADGQLVTGTGFVVTPEIHLPTDTLEISFDLHGRVSGRTAGSPDTSTQFGQLNLHRFMNPSALRPIGANVYRLTDESGQPITGTPSMQGLGCIKQGFVERSNVQLQQELINLQVIRRQHAAVRRSLGEYGVFVR